MVTHLTKAGLGSLELFSMGLKSTGTYLSRALSYKGAEFSIAKVDIDPQFQCVLACPLVIVSPVHLHDFLLRGPALWGSCRVHHHPESTRSLLLHAP